MRILLFLATNLAIIILVSLIFTVSGLGGILANHGVDLPLQALFVVYGLYGMSLALFSLVFSKGSAKLVCAVGCWIVTITAELVLGLFAGIIMTRFSRYREYRTDAAGAHLAGRAGVVTALKQLKAEQGQSWDGPGELTACGIRTGNGRRLGELLRSHPPLYDRNSALNNA